MSESYLQRLRQRVRPRRALRRLLRKMQRRRAALPRVLVNGFPKSGTHLLQQCVSLLPGLVWEWLWLPNELNDRLARLEVPPELAIREPRPPALTELDQLISSLGAGEYLMAHMDYNPAAVRLLEVRGVRSLLIVRDPRDNVVSLAFHLASWPGHPLHEYFHRTLRTDEERLLACIVGVEAPSGRGWPGQEALALRDIGRRLRGFRAWEQVPLNYTTSFERLVGPEGGGTAEEQRTEIENIAGHLGLSLSAQQSMLIASRLFEPGSRTFRRGQSGSWKEHFNEQHEAAFKRIAGQHLIEMGYERDLDW